MQRVLIAELNPVVLLLSAACLYERLLNALVERINLVLAKEFSSLPLPLRTNEKSNKSAPFLHEIPKMDFPALSIISTPGFISRSNKHGGLFDLLRNFSNDFLLSWFIKEHLEKRKNKRKTSLCASLPTYNLHVKSI